MVCGFVLSEFYAMSLYAILQEEVGSFVKLLAGLGGEVGTLSVA
jgi:hypothetical protein